MFTSSHLVCKYDGFSVKKHSLPTFSDNSEQFSEVSHLEEIDGLASIVCLFPGVGVLQGCKYPSLGHVLDQLELLLYDLLVVFEIRMAVGGCLST